MDVVPKKLPDLSRAVISDTELDKNQAWLNQRKGKFTASEFDRLMGYEDKEELTTGAETYVTEKVLELVTTSERKPFTTTSTEWGSNTEEEAVEEFLKAYSLEVENYGDNQKFIELNEHVGCTPDGLIGAFGGIETKCPDSKTHLYYFENLTVENFKAICKKYYWQVQGSMYITNRLFWYFVSYDPCFVNEKKRLFVLKIERNVEDIEKLKKRLSQAIKRKIERIKALE